MHRSKTQGINYNITNAIFLNDYTLLVTFANGITKPIDFTKALEKYAQGYYQKYSQPRHFKSFKIENNNIVWGKDRDFIFPPENIFNEKF